MTLLNTSLIRKSILFLVAAMLSVSAMALDFSQTQRLGNQGYVNSQLNLGNAYYNGNGVCKYYTQAFEWFQKSSNQGYAEAQFNLGVMYDEGLGVRQDYTKAFNLYQKSCNNGFQIGCDNYRKLNQR